MHLLLEKITVIPQHKEGQRPHWHCTNPTEQFGVGVFIWRHVEGAWSARLLSRASEEGSFDIHRIRLVVADWPGFPKTITFYDVIGETEPEEDVAGRTAMVDMLLSSLQRIGKPK